MEKTDHRMILAKTNKFCTYFENGLANENGSARKWVTNEDFSHNTQKFFDNEKHQNNGKWPA